MDDNPTGQQRDNRLSVDSLHFEATVGGAGWHAGTVIHSRTKMALLGRFCWFGDFGVLQ